MLATRTSDLVARMVDHLPRFALTTDRSPVAIGTSSWIVRSPLHGADHNTIVLGARAPEEDLLAALDLLGGRSALVLCTGGSGERLVAAPPAGLTAAGRAPLMTMDLASALLALDPDVTRAADARTLDEGRSLVRAAFGLEHDGLRPALSDGTGAELWVLHDEGRPVSTVVTTPDDDLVGVFAMGTPAEHARRGFGRRVLSHALATQAARGVGAAYLVATKAGEALYTALGFRPVEFMDVFVAGRSAQFR